MTQQQVAAQLKVYASFVSECEADQRRLDVVELGAFCKACDIELIDLLREAGLCKS